MKIHRSKYKQLIIALDGIKCDNEENRQDLDSNNPPRVVEDDVRMYIERKGYCKYIYGANCKFVRTLTEKGYEVLGTGSYRKYLWQQTLKAWAIWLPIVISVIALWIAYKDKGNDAKKINELEYKIKQLETFLKPQPVPIFHPQNQPTIQQNPKADSL